MSALSDLRVVELSSGIAGEYCGKLLADFGAEIIKVEPPVRGSDTRHRAPIVGAAAAGEGSGLFAYLNTNKRSVTLDVGTQGGDERLGSLVGAADVILDDHPRGYLERLGIDPSDVSSRPGPVVCSITPFGYDAPGPMQKAYGLNVFHSSGWGYHSPSEPDAGDPPLQGAGRFLVDYESGLAAAIAVLASLHGRESGGAGRFVDVSQQEALASLGDYVLGQMVAGAMEVSQRRDAFDLRGPATFFQCVDGHVYLWMSEPGHWNGMRALMGDPRWMDAFPERWLELHLSEERIERCRARIAQWMRGQHRVEVAARAQKLGVPLVPVNTVKDIFESPQVQHRGFFAQVEHPVLGSSYYPTVPYRLSATPARIERPAPLLGEHTDRVLSTVSGGGAGPAPGSRGNSRPGVAGEPRGGPLEGVRVLELTKVWAGPYAGKLLAFLGAEVIRVESHDSLDPARYYGVEDVDDAPGFQAVNPGKLSVQLNMKTEEGRRLVKELVKRSDIVLENLRPGAMERLGLGYAELRAQKADVIAVSMSMHGNEGPLSYQTGYAPCFSALGGVCHLVGRRDGPPKLLNVRYGDSSYGTAAAYAALVALHHRRRTGEGQFVDVSGVESMASVLGDVFMDYFLTGNVPVRDGNRHPELAPHGCYPCRGDEWISIAVRTDEEWQELCAALGDSTLAADPRFADGRSRRLHAEALDAILGAWTLGQGAAALGKSLRSRGVAAFKSLSSLDLVSDAHLWRRGFYPPVLDASQRSTTIAGAPWRLSGSTGAAVRAAPRLGEHNDQVLGELLGLSPQRRRQLIEEKIVY